MMDLFLIVSLFVVSCILSYVLGIRKGAMSASKIFIENMETMIDKAKNEDETETYEPSSEERNEVKIKIERHDGILYVYHKDTGAFIAQGKDEDEVTEAIKAKYPATEKALYFNADVENLKEVNWRGMNDSI